MPGPCRMEGPHSEEEGENGSKFPAEKATHANSGGWLIGWVASGWMAGMPPVCLQKGLAECSDDRLATCASPPNARNPFQRFQNFSVLGSD